jgi:hypothetical protein
MYETYDKPSARAAIVALAMPYPRLGRCHV